jgi:hypothetical protein
MVLRQAQDQTALLTRLEMELSRSREYIVKVRVFCLFDVN